MITNDDIKKLSSVFATKNDLDKKFEENLNPIHKKIDSMEKKITKRIDSMQKSLNTTISYFDTVTTDHETRVKKVEKKIDSFPLIASS